MPAVVIRDLEPADVPALLALVRELAVFERAADAVKASEDDFRRDGFGPQRRFESRILTIDGRAAGFTLFFPSYSTWEGRAGIYLEDFYVAEWARGRGYGKLLLQDVARIAVERGCPRLDLAVLAWNPARAFYEAHGVAHREEWLPYRVEGRALRALAFSETRNQNAGRPERD